MDCQTTLKLIDLCPPHSDGLNHDSVEVAAHLAVCENCRQMAEEIRQGDLRLSEALQDVDIPSGLLERLLDTVAAVESTQTAPAIRHDIGPPATPRRRFLLTALTVACSLILVVGGVVWWNLPQRGSELISFNVALDTLQQQFGSSEQASTGWDQRPAWDPTHGSVKLEVLDTLARKLQRFDPREVDLGGEQGAEAVAFKFSAGNAKGILVVLPGKFTSPAPANPVSPSQRVLTWCSPDGAQSYVCFIHSGRVEDLQSLIRTV